MQKYMPFASRSNECAYLMPYGEGPAITVEPVYLSKEADAEIERLQRAVEWCMKVSLYRAKDGRLWWDPEEDNDYRELLPTEVPAEFAEIIRPRQP